MEKFSRDLIDVLNPNSPDRGIGKRLQEWTNISGRSAEKFFNPEFKKVMIDLRLKDDYIRSVVAGEPIGEGDPGADATGLKQLLKSAKSNLGRREYMSAISDLGRFHAKILEVEQWIDKLDDTVNEVHHEFLFKDLDDDKRKHLADLKKRFASSEDELVKEAGLSEIKDFFLNIGTKRGRALALWEKRYPKKTAALKKETSTVLAKSEALLGTILSALKNMASARASRNVDAYMKAASGILKVSKAYSDTFKTYYDGNVKEFMKYIDIISPETKPEAGEVKKDMAEEGKKNTVNAPPLGSVLDSTRENGVETAPGHGSLPPNSKAVVVTDPDADPASRTSFPPSSEVKLPGPPRSPSPSSLVHPTGPVPAYQIYQSPSVPPNDGSVGYMKQKLHPTNYGIGPVVPPPVVNEPVESRVTSVPTSRMSPSEMAAFEAQHSVASHKSFYDSLESLSGESPMLLKAYIMKYARRISDSDPVTSIQLLKVAKNIQG